MTMHRPGYATIRECMASPLKEAEYKTIDVRCEESTRDETEIGRPDPVV